MRKKKKRMNGANSLVTSILEVSPSTYKRRGGGLKRKERKRKRTGLTFPTHAEHLIDDCSKMTGEGKKIVEERKRKEKKGVLAVSIASCLFERVMRGGGGGVEKKRGGKCFESTGADAPLFSATDGACSKKKGRRVGKGK